MISNTNGKLCLVLGRCASKSGQISKAEAHFAIVAVDASMPKLTKVLNATFVVSAYGDWVTAGQGLAQACRGGWYELCCAFHHLSSHLFWCMLLTEARMKLCVFCGPICTWDKLLPHGYTFTLMQVTQLTAGVTGTWSKKWVQGKFSNWAIKVRSFSGSGMGLGSGAVPPGMSL